MARLVEASEPGQSQAALDYISAHKWSWGFGCAPSPAGVALWQSISKNDGRTLYKNGTVMQTDRKQNIRFSVHANADGSIIYKQEVRALNSPKVVVNQLEEKIYLVNNDSFKVSHSSFQLNAGAMNHVIEDMVTGSMVSSPQNDADQYDVENYDRVEAICE